MKSRIPILSTASGWLTGYFWGDVLLIVGIAFAFGGLVWWSERDFERWLNERYGKHDPRP